MSVTCNTTDRGQFVGFFTDFYNDILRSKARFWSYVGLSIWVIVLFALSIAAYYVGNFIFTSIIVAFQSISFAAWLISFFGFWAFYVLECKSKVPEN